MGFDAQNFGIGLAVGWLSAYGVYRARHQISDAMRSARGGAESAQQSVVRSADSRYINDLTELAEAQHLGGMAVKLSSVLVPPRFIPAQPLAAPPDDEAVHDIFRVVPLVPDHPFLHGVYNVQALTVDELSHGSRALALLGTPGSGRTTALLAIALYSLGQLDFKPPVDKIQQKLDQEEAALSEKDRSVRVKERIMMEQRAKERLANEQGINFDAAEEEARKTLPLFRRLMPVYAHLADIIAPTGEFGQEVDPAEPLVRAVQFSVKRVTASTIPGALYKRLNQGSVLVLLDGYDELSPAEQPRAAAWLRAFMAQYGSNFVIVTGPVLGAGDLLDAGLTPVYVRPWSDTDVQRGVRGWADAYPLLAQRRSRKARAIDDAAVQRALMNNRGLHPAEVIFKTWANLGEEVDTPGYEGWLRAALSRLLPADQNLSALLPRLAQLAVLQLDEGYITAARMQTLRIEGIGTAVSGEGDSSAGEADSAAAGKTKERAADSESASDQGRLLASLRGSGLLARFRSDRYQFRHSLLASYAASLWLRNATADEQQMRSNQPAWAQAFDYLALHTPADQRVRARLNAPQDVLQKRALDVLRWMAFAPADAPWRGDALRLFSSLLMAPNQFPLNRERIAAALLDARDRSTLLIFRRAVRTGNADVRRLACLCLGALGDPEAIRDLRPLLNDQVNEVQLAAAMALGAIGTEEALEAMLVGFTEGSEQIRQALAEAFAAMPDEGYPILYDAISHEDMMLRRASVFGLRRVNTTWALIEIYRAFLEDEQWYVRSAAQQAFQELQYGRDVPLTSAYPQPDQIQWLAQWAAERGEKLPAGDAAAQVLVRALQEGEPEIRGLAALDLGQLGQVNAVKPLYAALRDRQDDVRAAAFRGLACLEAYTGERLPTPA